MSDSDTNCKQQGSVDTESSPLRVVFSVEDRETLLEMMRALNDRDIPVRTENITRNKFDGPHTFVLNAGDLTEKQRRTVQIAVQSGYYEQPRKTDLADLAKRIGISKSAVSQRLRGAEAKLIKNTFGMERNNST